MAGCVTCGCPTPRRQCVQCALADAWEDELARELGLDDDQDRPNDGIAYLGVTEVDRHYCDICERVFDALDELADHDCQPDDDPDVRMVADDSGAGRTVLGPNPVDFERWEHARNSGGGA